MNAISLGPLSLPVDFLIACVAIMVAQFVGKRVGRTAGVNPEASLWWVVACGWLGARVVHVGLYQQAYLADPLSIINIRDGGWNSAAGIAAALLSTAWLSWRRQAQRRALSAGVAAGAAVWVCAALALALHTPAHPPVPALTLVDLAGSQRHLAEFRGKPVVLNVWASWCPPCRREMSVLAEAQRRHSDVHFVFANQGEDAAAVTQYLGTAGLVLNNVLLDRTGSLPKALGAPGLPTTLFFDAAGQLVATRVGELSAGSLLPHLERIADVKKPAGLTPGGPR